MTIEIVQTLNNGIGHYKQVNILEGIPYILYFDFNTRDEHWYLSVHDIEDNPINGYVGRKLVSNWNPFNRVTDPDRPPGVFFVYEANDLDPGLEDLGDGSRSFLAYIPSTDLAEVIA